MNTATFWQPCLYGNMEAVKMADLFQHTKTPLKHRECFHVRRHSLIMNTCGCKDESQGAVSLVLLYRFLLLYHQGGWSSGGSTSGGSNWAWSLSPETLRSALWGASITGDLNPSKYNTSSQIHFDSLIMAAEYREPGGASLCFFSSSLYRHRDLPDLLCLCVQTQTHRPRGCLRVPSSACINC